MYHKIQIVLDHNSGQPQMPGRAYDGDAGDDLFVSRDVVIRPDQVVDVHTDIAIKLPEGFYARIVGRSSTLRKHGLIVNEGIIDCGYTGELFICVYNPTRETKTICAGWRLAQMIIQPIVTTDYNQVFALPETTRATSGFGSSGK